ncbi:taste receptor type 2 member 4-like [Erinaceus europaeus]|uniref:Taste receptor type 2 n=1 Tax=Erinaceus europaeus TaxID=9365 RepID=A0A1S2ZP61_ERIEU|nr:taste receptor type 2 member 4-like [Erinaceus europaeus]
MLQFISSVLIASAVFNFVGLLANLFIAVVNYKSWMQNHRISSSDRILFSLAITRFLMLGSFLLLVIYQFLFPLVLRSVFILIFSRLCWVFLESTSLWFMTLLNTLYCVKITNFQHSVFLLLKRNLSPKTPWLLLACVLISFFITLLYFVLRLTSPIPPYMLGRNNTEIDLNAEVLPILMSVALSCCLQFILNVASTSLVIKSLWQHIKMMQKNNTKFWNPRTEALAGAMKQMIYFLMAYVPHSVLMLLFYLNIAIGETVEHLTIYSFFSTLYHPGHSVLIVLTHPRLKAEAKKMLCFSRSCKFDCK